METPFDFQSGKLQKYGTRYGLSVETSLTSRNAENNIFIDEN